MIPTVLELTRGFVSSRSVKGLLNTFLNRLCAITAKLGVDRNDHVTFLQRMVVLFRWKSIARHC